MLAHICRNPLLESENKAEAAKYEIQEKYYLFFLCEIAGILISDAPSANINFSKLHGGSIHNLICAFHIHIVLFLIHATKIFAQNNYKSFHGWMYKFRFVHRSNH